MKYYLVRRQAGYGCDYTIGCGISVRDLHASSLEDAIEKVSGMEKGWQDRILQSKQVSSGEYSIEEYIHDYFMADTHLGDVEPNSERECKEISLLEVSREVDMIPLLKNKLQELKYWQQNIDDEEALKEQDAKDIIEFERLKKKFKK